MEGKGRKTSVRDIFLKATSSSNPANRIQRLFWMRVMICKVVGCGLTFEIQCVQSCIKRIAPRKISPRLAVVAHLVSIVGRSPCPMAKQKDWNRFRLKDEITEYTNGKGQQPTDQYIFEPIQHPP
jgi:hypothetical protein